MSLLTFSDVTKSYGYQDVLLGVSFFVSPGTRVGLIGANGAGKTTLLRMAVGEEKADSGRVTLQPNAQAALLSQDPLAGDPRPVRDAASRPTPELQLVWDELIALESAQVGGESVLARYDELHHRFQDLRGYELANRAPEVLVGLGFRESSWDRPASVLSGGERTRLALAQLLIRQPDLLLLDEPTNHIDWEACEWLQDYLNRYPGAALIVSHDRYFLDRVVAGIVELEAGRAKSYRGNYTEYSKKKAFEQEQAEEAHRRRQEEMERQEAIIQRLRSHRKFNSMHSRERTLSKLRDEAPERPRDANRRMRVAVGQTVRTGREVLVADRLEHGFETKTLFTRLTLSLERGERLAIVGPNGAGKTTLLRILAGELLPRAGTIGYGHRVQPAYFSQDLAALDPGKSVWETLWETEALDQRETFQILHRFLFFGEAVEKQVADLSGGERTRLALCLLLATRPNLLLLDEPTNHLDLPSREAVEGALAGYPGAVVAVSHDRYFLQAVATRVLEMREGRHRFFDGGFERYRESLAPARVAIRPASKKVAAPAPRGRPEPPAKRLPKLEKEIAAAEERTKEVTQLLGDAGTWSSGKAEALSAEYEALSTSLEALYAEWAELAQTVEAAGAAR